MPSGDGLYETLTLSLAFLLLVIGGFMGWPQRPQRSAEMVSSSRGFVEGAR